MKLQLFPLLALLVAVLRIDAQKSPSPGSYTINNAQYTSQILAVAPTGLITGWYDKDEKSVPPKARTCVG